MNPKEEVKKALEAAKNSPVAHDECYIATRHLCNVIPRLVGDVLEEIEGIEKRLKDNQTEGVEGTLEACNDALCEIDTIAQLIRKRADYENFRPMCDLVYHLNELEFAS